MQISSSWKGTYSSVTFETDFGVKFAGPGLYLTEEDTVLLVPNPPDGVDAVSGENMWREKQSEHTLYIALVYNQRLDKTILPWIHWAPLRSDRRRHKVTVG